MPGTDRKLYGEVPCAHNDPIGGSFKFARLKLLLLDRDRQTERKREVIKIWMMMMLLVAVLTRAYDERECCRCKYPGRSCNVGLPPELRNKTSEASLPSPGPAVETTG